MNEELTEALIEGALRYAADYCRLRNIPDSMQPLFVAAYLSGVSQCSMLLIENDGGITPQNVSVAVNEAATRLGFQRRIIEYPRMQQEDTGDEWKHEI